MNDAFDNPSALKIFWGDSHHNLFVASDRQLDLEGVCREARKHLDFLPLAYYTALDEPYRPEMNASGTSGISLEGWKPQKMLEQEWAQIEEATRQFNAEGSFVTFPGYEWHGNGTDGDHNVIFPREGGKVHRVDRLTELYRCLRDEPAYAIPHHTAYLAGHRGRDWSVCDERITPFAEIFSCHGCSETDEEWVGMRSNPQMGPNFGGGTYQDALNRGLHLGAICSTDSFGGSKLSGRFGFGLMACLATGLSRQELWEAFGARRVYGVTGDRIALDFTINGQHMGSRLIDSGIRQVRVEAEGLDAIDRIELLRNDRVIATHCHQGHWNAPRSGHEVRMRFRIECGWGPSHLRFQVPPKAWKGELTLSAGRFMAAWPCWVSTGQSLAVLNGNRATFEMLSRPEHVRERWQNANVFEVLARPEDRLQFRINGLEDSFSLSELLRTSRGIYDHQGAVAMLAQARNLRVEEAERADIYHHVAHKVKIHRGIPADGYTALLEVNDDWPLSEEVHYRVRVEQRNGQRAWSSPIWVRP